MTRDEILKEFQVDSHGIIMSPGKFEGEFVTAPYFYDAMMNGFGDIQDDDGTIIEVTDEDRKEFPKELHDIKRVRVYIGDTGFIYVEHITV